MPLAVRKVVLILLAALSSAGCAGGPWIGEVDRSCRATPPGDPTATPEALDGLDRLNCYRLHIGLEAASLDARLSAAAQAHAEYLAATGEQGHGENTAHPSSTGSSPSERVEVAGFDLDDFETSLSEVVGFRSGGADAALAVDFWMRTVYHRTPLTTPGVEAVGVGQAGIYDVMLLAAPWEAEFDSPEFEVGQYPAPGQTQVVRSFDTDRELPDPDLARSLVGLPISLTFLDRGFVSGDDLYGISVDDARLRNPSGQLLPTALLLPSSDALLRRSVVLIPEAPLEPSTEYSVSVHGVVGGDGFVQEWGFRTEGDE